MTTAGQLVVGERLTAGIQAPGDLDLFKFVAEPGVIYQFDALGYAGIASSNATVDATEILSDPFMRLFGERGELIFRADDGGIGGDARAYYKNESDTDQTVFLQVSSANTNQLGTYQVEVNPYAFVDNDIGNIPAEAKPITLGEAIDRPFNARDVDVFAVNLLEGERYVSPSRQVRGKARSLIHI